MRLLAVCLLVLVALTGCVAERAQTPHDPLTSVDTIDANYSDATIASASALVFDPPVLAGNWAPDLGREARQPSAFLGYDEVTTTYFYLRTDDRQVVTDWDGDRYERRAISEKYGVRYR